jgi:hypothetical protein
MTKYFLNLATGLFPENRTDGLMICGINWGGADDSDYQWTHDVVGDSFFSDARFNNFPYRNRLVKWFELLGHPLEVSEDRAGAFERSVVQTNWLRNQSPNMAGKSVFSECVREWGNFEFHASTLKPRLVMFMSLTLLEALNASECLEGARKMFGTGSPPVILKRDVRVGGSALKAFRVGFQQFERVQVVALPHPTGSKGLSDDYIRAFRDVVSPIIARFKAERGFHA